ncbi:Rne/Rng family ribonuclease [Nocardioides xinjiangensis]|uniref:Rne/Rng family ribonuclease n=1 Tax=Nocardioides xinjiangensis TaxID=2817376 RepID=UPI001B3092FE|nr:Rne/Rng family ribonuclease [Nocardioides sp. SYSU D00778]
MLDDDQPDRTEAGTAAPGDAPAAADAPAAPVVTRRTRKSPAKKAAAAAPASPAAPDPDAAAAASSEAPADPPAKKTAARKAPARKTTTRKTTAKRAGAPAVDAPAVDAPTADAPTVVAPELEAAVEAAEAAEVSAPPKRAARKSAAAKTPAKKAAPRRSTAKKTAASPAAADAPADVPTETTPETAPETAADTPTEAAAASADATAGDAATGHAVVFQAPVVTTTRRARKKPAPVPVETPPETTAEAPVETTGATPDVDAPAGPDAAARPARKTAQKRSRGSRSGTTGGRSAGSTHGRSEEPAEPVALASAPVDGDEEALDAEAAAVEATDAAAETQAETQAETDVETDADADADVETTDETTDADEDAEGGTGRRRRRRGGRRRRKSSDNGEAGDAAAGTVAAASDEGGAEAADAGDAEAETTQGDATEGNAEGNGEGNGEGSSRRRRRRRRAGDEGAPDDDDANTVTRVRKTRSAEDQITAVSGSTRLEAKKQRRREGREAGRRRAPIVSEAEFLARRESVDRVMVIRQRHDLTQIGVLEDRVLVEHYVARESQTSLIGNVYLGRVQNVLPSMEAAFIDIGKGRNAVLYAGEVNWQALGHKEGQPRKIESVLSSGQMVLVQVTKDPVGHKGARLTSQVSLAGRFLVYVPDGTTSGISRKLPDTERNRLKTLLKEIVPDTAGVIVRTAAEGASEEELTRDVERLKARWEEIEKKATHKGSGPQLLYGEPDLTLKVVRDLFTEDFSKLVIEGDDAWDTVHGYVESVAPDLADRVQRFERGTTGGDVFATYRIDEQIAKGLDRKVWLPSGGSLIIDRTEAMTVVDVNTGKFTGSGGNLEETVTKNNLEAAEEIVRQLRLRDIGGIIVVDFIDMVLESNRDLVVRRLVECLGRDRTRHQVAEVTSLGLVQMTRKRIGTGLVEAFSENCEHCNGRGVVIKDQPVDPNAKSDDGGEGRRGNRRRGRRGSAAGDDDNATSNGNGSSNGNANGNGNGGARPAEPLQAPSPKDVAAMARHDKGAEAAPAEVPEGSEAPEQPAPEQQAPEQPAPEQQAPEQQAPEQQAPEQAPEPEKPRVVTRTRRRAASRPAGPPAVPATSGVGTVPVSGVVEPGTVAVEPAHAPVEESAVDAPAVEHVPIKKKGTRKR